MTYFLSKRVIFDRKVHVVTKIEPIKLGGVYLTLMNIHTREYVIITANLPLSYI